jgi:hypothetical protein
MDVFSNPVFRGMPDSDRLLREHELGKSAWLNIQRLDCTYTWSDPANIANGSQIASPAVTVPGAEPGDFVAASSDTALSGLRLWGEVTAADTVTLYLGNTTGDAVDPATLSVYVRVDKSNPA